METNQPTSVPSTNTAPDHKNESVHEKVVAPHAHRSHFPWRRWSVIGVLSLLSLGGLGFGAGLLQGIFKKPLHSLEGSLTAAPNSDGKALQAKVIRPKMADSVPIVIEHIALVEPYYRADLRARASGIVRTVHVDIGDKVKLGDLLIEIDVPESDQEVARSQALNLQREQELKVSAAKLKDAQAAKDVSSATVKQRLADVDAASATRDLKKKRYLRFKSLAAQGSVVGNVVEEEERDFVSSEAAVSSAKANVEKARADFAESESKIEAALADIDLKKAQIEVAKKELDRAKAVADYARITAPFDGVIIRRTVDPGSFVQNATTGASDPLISLAKVDLVTVSARFPDSVAPFVSEQIQAQVQVDDLPNLNISTMVTRFAPSVQNADHTMRVEVDLFNGDEAEYQTFLRQGFKAKGAQDEQPTCAFPNDTPKSRRLIPGMTGRMKLSLAGFGKSYVLPSSVVFSRGGITYLLLVEEGKTKQVPVRVQLNDGNVVRVALLQKRPTEAGKTREILTELTGEELIVAARQVEIGDGTTIQPNIGEW